MVRMFIRDLTKYINYGTPNIHSYFSHLKGKMFYVLQIEPENKWFANATQMLSDKYSHEAKHPMHMIWCIGCCNFIKDMIK